MKEENKDKHILFDNEGNQVNEEDFVVTPMNVEGMPWYNERENFQTTDKTQKTLDGYNNISKLTRKEELLIMWGSMKAALLVALVFCGALVLFVLFCIYIWF